MTAKNFTWTIIFLIIVGIAAALENYADYGIADDDSLIGGGGGGGGVGAGGERGANIRDIYRMLVQRSVDGGPEAYRYLGLGEHLQPRAVERSPSLRLRFGRSYAKYPRSPSLRLRFGRSYNSPASAGLASRLNEVGSPAAAAAGLAAAAAAATSEEN